MCKSQSVLYNAEAEALESKELELDGKNIIIELKKNDQGKFVKIMEMQGNVRGRIILSSDKALELRSILNEFVAEYERLPPAEETTESERIKTYAISCEVHHPLPLFLPLFHVILLSFSLPPGRLSTRDEDVTMLIYDRTSEGVFLSSLCWLETKLLWQSLENQLVISEMH